VVHNGIIENFSELRAELMGHGAVFATETDTEVVAHLVTEEMKNGAGPISAVAGALPRLKGAFALAFLCPFGVQVPSKTNTTPRLNPALGPTAAVRAIGVRRDWWPRPPAAVRRVFQAAARHVGRRHGDGPAAECTARAVQPRLGAPENNQSIAGNGSV
jgi:hypothetical protein